MQTFLFDFDKRFRTQLRLVGINEGNALVSVGDGHLDTRFGRWRVRTPLDNVAGAEVTGPYSWVKAIGVRLSFTDRGLTFGTTPRRGVCIRFRRPVKGMDPLGILRHPGLTVTVLEPDRLVEAIEAGRRGDDPLSPS